MTFEVLGESSPRVDLISFAYDVFVVHAAADEWFVQGYLLGKLGLAPERVLVPGTLELGQFIIREVERGVRSSRVTIVVLSFAYMGDHWAEFGEQIAAYASVAKDVHGVLLPLLLEDCELPTHIRALVKLDFRSPACDGWEAEVDRLRDHLDRPASPEPDLPCPYPGMRPFTGDDAARFFGRNIELDRILRRLQRGEREIYIIGASGSGKSSLIAAGLVPRLTHGIAGLPRFHVLTIRPGERPLDQLVVALEGDIAALAATLGSLLERHAPATSLLLVIDQLEELFAIASADQRHGFFATVRTLRADPRCVLVFTLRADFYGAFMDSPLWTDRDGGISRIDLGPLHSDSLRTVIESPARNLGVYFQPELVSRLLDDAAHEPGALPLLQETLFQLWSKRRQRLLALADYHALSDGARTGLAFAVKEHADDVIAALTDTQKVIAFRILLRLVNFGEGREDTRRQQARDALRSDGESAADFDSVLQHLLDNRLLTVTGDDQREDIRVDLAHEILIHAWSTFAEQIRSWRIYEQRRRELEAAATAWRTRGSGDGGLLDPIEIAFAVAWRMSGAHQVGYSLDLTALLAASKAAQSQAIRQRLRRVQLALAATALFVVVTSALALIARNNAMEAEQERSEAIEQRGKAVEQRREAIKQRREAVEQRGEAVEQRNQRDRLLAESLQIYLEIGRQRLIESERPLEALPYLVAARAATETSGGTPSSSLRMLFAEATRNLRATLPLKHQGKVSRAAFSSDGARVVTASWDNTARVWDATSGKPLSPPLQHQGKVYRAAFSPDGTRVVTASSDHTARVWEATSGKALTMPLRHEALVLSAAFSPDGTRVITASDDHTARIWDAASGKPLSPPLQHQGPLVSAAFSPDGTRIVTASDDHTARVWDAASGNPLSLRLRHQSTVQSAAFSPDGRRIITASLDHTARIWDAASGKPLSPPITHQAPVVSAAFSPDGRRVVTASLDHTARVWDAASGKPLSPPLQHQDFVVSAAFSPDGTRVVTGSKDGTARVWDVASGKPLSSPLQHQGALTSAVFSPDGRRVVTASADNTACIWDVGSSRSRAPLTHTNWVVNAAFNSDGTRIVTASWDHTARVWDAASSKPLSPPLTHQDRVNGAAFSPDGTRVVTASADHTARVWDAVSGKPLSPPIQHQLFVSNAAFSPDGTRVVTASDDKMALVWDATSGKLLSRPLPHEDFVWDAAFSSDGTRVVTASYDHTARVWDAASGKPVSPPLAHHDQVRMAAFSPDGMRVVTASYDYTARIWDAATGNPVTSPLQHQDVVWSVAFSPDGRRVVTASGDHTARVWDAASGTPVSPPLAHQDYVASAAFSPDGTRVVTASGDHTARVWDATTGKPLSAPLTHQGTVYSAAFCPDGTCLVTASEDSTARVWDLPLALGTLAEWRTIAELTSLYANGIASPPPSDE